MDLLGLTSDREQKTMYNKKVFRNVTLKIIICIMYIYRKS